MSNVNSTSTNRMTTSESHCLMVKRDAARSFDHVGTLPPEALHVLNLAPLLPADSIALLLLQAVGSEKTAAFNVALGFRTSRCRKLLNIWAMKDRIRGAAARTHELHR
jgi:hypothetical protein